MKRVMNPNVEIMELAAEQLTPLLGELVFVGGCATGLLISDRVATPVRITKDVDAIVQVTSLRAYQGLSKQLRACGFREDTTEDAPVCRWQSTTVMLDIMPTDKQVLGFGNDWYVHAMQDARKVSLPSGKVIRLVSSPCFLITKLSAFEGRGKGDYQMSHDIEDIITVIDGRPELLEEIKKTDISLKVALAEKFSAMLSQNRFVDAVYGHMLPDGVSQGRVPRILNIMEQISGLK